MPLWGLLCLATFVWAAAAMAQSPAPPVFKAETYVVVYDVSSFKRTWYGGSKPDLDLKADDVQIVLEGKVYVPSKLEPDKKRPGHYFLGFTPPEEFRDGKPHQIETRIKGAPIKSTETFPKVR
jgi:hypothetical protein